MSEYTEEEQRILAYLTDSVTRGERYVRSKTIADAIGLTAKQVGSRLPVSPKNPTTSTSRSGVVRGRRRGA